MSKKIDTDQKVKMMNAHLEQFREMSHRTKNRIERLAELSLVIEDELRHQYFADRVNDLFSVSNLFETKIEELIQDYEIERNRVVNEELPA